ncbi:hypothetical protein [Italian clover phyllody phytoplasma]|uniref:hypothetical protein n=1 Tax=Italian clover phyllody phytoplasma TaxID=1196420 RepID=UPI0002F94E82|nr:hypothetical protein [Italian clover phyllody phytoplasma]
MTKNISEFRKKIVTTLIFFITFLTLFTGKHVHTFNPEDYEIDYNRKHNIHAWKHKDDHTFNSGGFFDWNFDKNVSND